MQAKLIKAGGARLRPAQGHHPRHRHRPLAYLTAGFRVKRSDISGKLLAHAASVAGAASYEVDLAKGDPTAEASWHDAGNFASCSHIELTGLTPGQVYWVRLRAIGSSGPGPWSDPVSTMVV